MPTFYRLAADVTVLLHLAYVAGVVLGLLAVWVGYFRQWNWVRLPWFRWGHLAMILIVVVEAWAGITCPLTTLEQALRQRAGQATYSGSFIANAVHDLLFFDLPPWSFTLVYTAFGGLVALAFSLVPVGRPAPCQKKAPRLSDQTTNQTP